MLFLLKLFMLLASANDVAALGRTRYVCSGWESRLHIVVYSDSG